MEPKYEMIDGVNVARVSVELTLTQAQVRAAAQIADDTRNQGTADIDWPDVVRTWAQLGVKLMYRRDHA